MQCSGSWTVLRPWLSMPWRGNGADPAPAAESAYPSRFFFNSFGDWSSFLPPFFSFGFPAVWCACIDSVIPVLHDWLKRSNVQFASEVIFEVPFFFVGIQLMDPFFGKRFDG